MRREKGKPWTNGLAEPEELWRPGATEFLERDSARHGKHGSTIFRGHPASLRARPHPELPYFWALRIHSLCKIAGLGDYIGSGIHSPGVAGFDIAGAETGGGRSPHGIVLAKLGN
jgi:hypothetical protein